MTITKYTPDQAYGLTVDRADPGGCWAVYAYDVGPYVVSVHATELDAYKAAVASSANVVWLPWGTELTDALKTPETA